MAKTKPPIKKKYIETPEKLWQLFCDYKEQVKKNPITVKDWVGGMGKLVSRPKERPLTMDGFECFGYDNNVTVGHYFDNPEGSYETYRTIATRIRKEIRNDQIGGGMAGIYNQQLTARLNGLVEKTENKHEVSSITIKED